MINTLVPISIEPPNSLLEFANGVHSPIQRPTKEKNGNWINYGDSIASTIKHTDHNAIVPGIKKGKEDLTN